VDRTRDILTVRAVACSWLAAAVAAPVTILLAVGGQGVGSVLGGCRWIGLSTPVDQQVWALVNQPTLAFAARSIAVGYWLGAPLAALLVAVLVVPYIPRPQSLAAELSAVQLAWFAAVYGLAWIPLLDLDDGHLARWLLLRRLPDWLVFVAPAAGALVALIPSLRLLALVAATRRAAGRLTRLLAVTLHLLLPLAACLALASVMAGKVQVVPLIASLPAPVVALGLAWVGLPRPHVFPLTPVSGATIGRLLGTAVVLVTLVAIAGRPLPDGRRSGILWARPADTNNIRPWIDPIRLLGARSPGPARATPPP
jgi:hypothetical protein